MSGRRPLIKGYLSILRGPWVRSRCLTKPAVIRHVAYITPRRRLHARLKRCMRLWPAFAKIGSDLGPTIKVAPAPDGPLGVIELPVVRSRRNLSLRASGGFLGHRQAPQRVGGVNQ
jgi:hypothetical protein